MGFLCSVDNNEDKAKCYHAEIRGGRENKLKVMADFSSSGIWDGHTGVMIDYDYIFDGKELADEFQKWIKYYDESFEEDFSTLKKGTAEKYNKWGRELAKKLKDKMVDLGTGEWEITYQGEDENGVFEIEMI
jgi:hypothetical protein